MEKGSFIVEEEQLSVQAGVPRREQCLVCDKPIFLAERFRVGDRFYHRRCLRCARCQTQLTLGNFYETEVDGQFCCETCPDEEQRRRVQDEDSEEEEQEDVVSAAEMERQKRLAAAAEEEKRISSLISNRLAMFERKPEDVEVQGPSSWRNSSLSDEQKSRSMKKFLEAREEESTSPPPLPSQGPPPPSSASLPLHKEAQMVPEIRPEVIKVVPEKVEEVKAMKSENSSPAIDEEVILRPPPIADDKTGTGTGKFVRESQSVSNIRAMFEKNDQNKIKTEERMTPAPVSIPRTVVGSEDQGPPVVEKDRPESISTFYSPISVPRVDRLAKDKDTNLVLEFKTPRKPSEEDWRDVQGEDGGGMDKKLIEASDETIKVEKELIIEGRRPANDEEVNEDDVFLTPRPVPAKRRTDRDDDMNNLEDVVNRSKDAADIGDVKMTDETKYNKVTTTSDGKEIAIVPEVTIVTNDKDDDDNIKVIGNTQRELFSKDDEAQGEEGETIEDAESSATKESDPIIKEPSLESSGGGDDDDNIERALVEIDVLVAKVQCSTGTGAGDNDHHHQKSPVQDENKQNESRVEVKTKEEQEKLIVSPKAKETSKVADDEDANYPLDLNPFGSDNEEESELMEKSVNSSGYNASLNPFGGDDEDDEEQKIKVVYRPAAREKNRVSTNPFGSDEDDEEAVSVRSDSIATTPGKKRITPMPTPRRTVMSQRPEPSPRSSHLRLPHSQDYYGSVSSLSKSSDFLGSTNSLSSTCSSANTSGTYQRTLKKRRAPLPPAMREANQSADALLLSPSPRKSSNASMVSDQSGQKSTSTSPRGTLRKKRPAPKPPGPSPSIKPTTSSVTVADDLPEKITSVEETTLHSPPSAFESRTRHSTPLKLNHQSMDERSENYFVSSTQDQLMMSEITEGSVVANQHQETVTGVGRRVIPVDDQLLEDQRKEEEMMSMTTTTTTTTADPLKDVDGNGDNGVLYRRVIKPILTDDDANTTPPGNNVPQDVRSRQWEKLKQNKESENRNRQSLVSNSSDSGGGGGMVSGELDRFYNKSQQGKWKRRKGPAPSLPVPPKRVLQMLPMHDIKHELEVIEVQQQGLEKQGVQLEKMIREKTEGGGPDGEDRDLDLSALSQSNTKNTTEVEGLIMQLFDLVVEKNELFRRQAELMYQRRQHRLEVEQADLEYEIRVLMAQPECNKTDSDKAKEETMIARLMEVVRQRNAVVDGLEMDRLREAQEDLGIKQEMENYTAKRDEEFSLQKEKPVKLSKKEKKTLKEEKKKLKNKKLDVDKDYDETETSSPPGDKSVSSSSGSTLEKIKKKRKKFLIL